MIPLSIPDTNMNSWPPISTTLFMNSSCVMIRKTEKASNTSFLSADFDLHLKNPKMEIEEKKSPTNVAITAVYVFHRDPGRQDWIQYRPQYTPQPPLFQ